VQLHEHHRSLGKMQFISRTVGGSCAQHTKHRINAEKYVIFG
jgi:hypothetical protein